MTEAKQLVSILKARLKQQNLTYRDVAAALKLSEPSVKRLFASGRFTLDRLVQVCNLLGYTLAELSKEAQTSQPLATLTERQEAEVVADTRLLLIAVCVLNHWTLKEIISRYEITEPECIKHLLHLDRLRIIDLLPGNRIRLNVSREFDWLPKGPIRRYFRSKGLHDFLESDFTGADEAMAFTHGMFTDQAMAQVQDELRKLRQKFAELHEASLAAPLAKRSGAGLLLAMRSWEPEDFAKLRK